MNRILQIGSMLLLVAGVSYGGKRQEPKDSPRPPSQPAPAKPAAPKGGVPKAGIPKGGARLVNPANIAARLYRMTPEEREHALEKLPNEQARERARKELELFDSLPKEAQEIQLRRLDRFAQLTPEKRAEVRGLMAEANALPPNRAAAVRQTLYQLQKLTDEQRESMLQRPAFQARFSPEELRVIRGLADAWMGPVQ
jgi:hypothetical protein